MPNNEWGDFQTPMGLAEQVVDAIGSHRWNRVLEPTCGAGNFLTAAKKFTGAERVGVELHQGYADEARGSGARIVQANIFDLNLHADISWERDGRLLVIGNPPWVTNSQLGVLGSINVPPKSNIRGLRGFEALTGASNFDIAEFIWLKLIVELTDQQPTISLLCKTQVARNVFQFCHNAQIPLSRASIRRIDAKKWFGAAVDACLFTVTVGGPSDWTCPVYANFEASEPEACIGFADGRLVADSESHRKSAFADGSCPFEWRQGVKHDAAGVMELAVDGESGSWTSRKAGHVEVEGDFVYPLLKCTDLHRGRLLPTKMVIVTQRSLKEDPGSALADAPRLLKYLNDHGDALDRRKSSIYVGRPRFSMFGIGDYTFAPWKVAVSGLHGSPVFRLIGAHDGKPVLFDDTCYFLPFDDGVDAAITTALLASETTSALVRSLTFSGTKRPVNKKLLQRIDLAAIAGAVLRTPIEDEASSLLGRQVDSEELDRYVERLHGGPSFAGRLLT